MKFKIITGLFIVLTLFGIFIRFGGTFKNWVSEEEKQVAPKLSQGQVYQQEQKKKQAKIIENIKEGMKQEVLNFQAANTGMEFISSDFSMNLEDGTYLYHTKNMSKNTESQTSGILPTVNKGEIRWGMEDDKVIVGKEEDLHQHDLMVFNRHLMFDSYSNAANLYEGQWYFGEKTSCPSVTGKNLEYFHMSLGPHKWSGNWIIGNIRFHGNVVRSLSFNGYKYGGNTMIPSIGFSCTSKGIIVNDRKDVNLVVQLSGERLGIAEIKDKVGSKSLMFIKQPFLKYNLDGTYSGMVISHKGIRNWVNAEVKDEGMTIIIKAPGGVTYKFSGDGPRDIFAKQNVFFEAIYSRNGRKGEGLCMSSAVVSDDRYNTPLIYCLGTIGGKAEGTNGFLLRRNFE